jgi:uncharacterized protein (DUF1499 family)
MSIQITAAIIALVLGLGAVKNNKTPNNIGVNNGKFAELSKKPNNVSSQTDVEEKYVEPLKFIDNLDESKAKILDILSESYNANIITNEENYIYAVVSTKLMRYKDDLEFYFDEQNKIVHFRSSSRIGYSDMGLNRKRYEEIVQKYYE